MSACSRASRSASAACSSASSPRLRLVLLPCYTRYSSEDTYQASAIRTMQRVHKRVYKMSFLALSHRQHRHMVLT